jgi:hypothetical protein
MRFYKDVFNELKEGNITGVGGDMYDFSTHALRNDYQSFFEFCQKYLDRKDQGFDFKKARIFYSDNSDENAAAYLEQDYYIVEIFKGTIEELDDFFRGKNELFGKASIRGYRDLIKNTGQEPGDFLFQYASLFFIYHETGHLLQRTLGGSNNIEFATDNCIGAEVKEQHIREFDADWFASQQMAFHIVDFAKLHSNNPAGLFAMVSDVAAISIAGIFCHFIKWARDFEKIYYEENCHPHPLVRVLYIVRFLLDAINNNVNRRPDEGQVLHNALILCEVLMMEPGNNVVEKLIAPMHDQMDKIETYIKKIMEDAESYPFLSRKVMAPNQG